MNIQTGAEQTQKKWGRLKIEKRHGIAQAYINGPFNLIFMNFVTI